MDLTPLPAMDDKHLGQYAENTARSLVPEGATWGLRVTFMTKESLGVIAAVRDHAGRSASPAAEWLLDNWYLIQREGTEGAAAFRRVHGLRYVRREGKQPVVLELARAFVHAAGAEAGAERLELFLNRAQAALPLTELELALLIPALKCALAERLARVCRELDREEDQQLLAVHMGAAFTALRTISTADFGTLLERASRVESILGKDPAGVYGKMDEDTRRRYRQRVCRLAKREGLSEFDMAEKAVRYAAESTGEARHVGYPLFCGKEHRTAKVLYVGGIVLVTLFLTLLAGFWLDSIWAALLLILPVSDVVKNCADFLVVRLLPPRAVHRLALEEGIPVEGRTLCVIATLLTSAESGEKLAGLLEQYRLANRDAGAELRFGLLADLPDGDHPMGSREQEWVDRARESVEKLNRKYGGGFYLFFRTPVFHAPDERYMGWERKRGALVELVRLLKGRRSGIKVVVGDAAALALTRYVLTLDSDTTLNVGAAREFVGAMLHPLNRPRVDKKRGVVTSGYGLLQPRVSVDLESANRSQFSRIFAGQGGVDPYGSAASDVYHDLFDEGTYTGKGIFDVEAFYACLDRRLPRNAVLSHDLLEGAYLRAGLAGDVELADGYPYKVISYFSRLHRWVRGDWQVLPWLLRKVRNEDGEKVLNPISAMAKWKILDNLRRSLSPVSTLLALLLGMCLSGTVFAFAAGAAILSAASNLLLSGAELAFRGGRGFADRYHSTIITGFGGILLQTLVQLLFLPFHAWICASAAVTALWRMSVAHKGLLAWTTAAEAERKAGDSVWAYYCKMWPAVAVGFFCILCSVFPAGAAVGLVWAASPAFAWALSRPVDARKGVAEEDRPFLLNEAGMIWNYFCDFLRPEDHWLPPDNWQEQPVGILARRTSPTNIGMALLCCLAAADLDLCGKKKAAELVGHILDNLEKLPRWDFGHFYNWYDTSTAIPLEPRYVSTVDSGNLCGSLIALREGLAEWGEAALAERAGALADAIDFSVLYDRSRRLFTIGYDCSKETYTQGWYDLMASEARQTSFLAVARGEVEQRHWRRLSRMLVGQDHYSGMASWTGTMFEYFMPHLLLPAYENSLLYESLTFCVYAQKKRTAGHAPWGISESCFFAFDAAMNYQYKAHGVQRLGLKRGLDRELVVSPYSSFLALATAPRSAVKNLRRLRELGLGGPYGLYESADFTESRLTGKRPFESVRTYMAHHLGMSLLSIDNALNGQTMQKRFMRDASMSAYRELLQEKVPVGARIMRAPRREIPEKPRRDRYGAFQRSGEGWAAPPECHILSGGAWNVLCTDGGCARSVMGKTAITRCEFQSPYEAAGVSFFLKLDGKLISLTPAPLYQKDTVYSWMFRAASVQWTARKGEVRTALTLRVPEQETGEVWEAGVIWKGQHEVCAELVCYLEPILAKQQDYAAHPAFSKLSIESAAQDDGVLFTRRPRRRGESRPALAVAWNSADASYDTSREKGLGRGGLKALELALGREAAGSAGAVLDPCLLARFPLILFPGQEASVRVALSASDSGEFAWSAAQRLLKLPARGEPGRLDRIIRSDNLTSGETLHAFELLRRMEFPPGGGIRQGSEKQRSLWPHGISGDLPVTAVRVEDQDGAEKCMRLVKEHQLLARCGYAFDLVFLLSEGGDYHRPIRAALTEGLKKLDWHHKLGTRGGVHLVEAEGLAATVTLENDGGLPPLQSEPIRFDPPGVFEQKPGMPPWRLCMDGMFVFDTGEQLPPVGWSMMLCNERFGWMTDETGNGHLWYQNARENQLTPWHNDPLRIGGEDAPVLHTGSRACAFLAAPDGNPCTVTYGKGTAAWKKEWNGLTLRCTAFVPPELDARILILEGAKGQVSMGSRSWPMEEVLWLKTDGSGTEPMEPDQNLLNRTRSYWERLTSRLSIRTPDSALNQYLNGWALYQVIACRLFGRTSLYQNGGAYGFRDQLQDVCAVLLTAPELARAQILRACAHQYAEGDVQHWWHPALGESPEKGVRTRISDDLLWLPYVLCEYLEKTGDRSLLDERMHFLAGTPLREDEHERYGENCVSEEAASVLEHAKRAVDCALRRGFGAHGLALMGTGDWNDGMDLVGARGRGESVWLTWFLSLVLERFAPLCEGAEAQIYREAADKCADAANVAWDGAWFLRGYYDDGKPLGGRENTECRIDSIAQSFAALNPRAERGKAERAVRSALELLFDREHNVVKLFTPPFDQGERDPGYIRGYVPGVRENGGQYTHAAVWLAMACFRLGWNQDGLDVLNAILPTAHNEARYKAEPYVLAADVYSNPTHEGRGGWTWYTGAAGWYYRAAVEELLGLKVKNGKLCLEPHLPDSWPGYSGIWKTDRAVFHLEVRKAGRQAAWLDGIRVTDSIPIYELSGTHEIEFTI